MTTSDDIVHDPDGGMDRLVEIMRRLRDPESGCPWDIEQDFATIAPYTIEEAYEVADAIEREAWDELRGELGDLLFQSVFHAQMAAERGLFDIHDVANGARLSRALPSSISSCSISPAATFGGTGSSASRSGNAPSQAPSTNTWR